MTASACSYLVIICWKISVVLGKSWYIGGFVKSGHSNMHCTDQSNIADRCYTEVLLQMVYHVEDLMESDDTECMIWEKLVAWRRWRICHFYQKLSFPGLYSTKIKIKKNPDAADPLVFPMSVCLEMNISGWAVIRLDVVQGLCRLLLPAVASPIFTRQTCTHSHSQGWTFLENSKQMCNEIKSLSPTTGCAWKQ